MSYEKLTYEFYNKKYSVYFELAQYVNTENMAVMMLTDDEVNDAPFGTCTVNLGMRLQMGYAYIDENNLPGITSFLEENRLGSRISGCTAMSGFCTYQLFKFDMEELLKYTKYDRRKNERSVFNSKH